MTKPTCLDQVGFLFAALQTVLRRVILVKSLAYRDDTISFAPCDRLGGWRCPARAGCLLLPEYCHREDYDGW